ncbi:hypothetical protein GQ602_003809 [Ophiocordyceps camponoti-floridani]|uniref:Uncharacterized protein n=1 Tax=Ophiocordyceps camponoti-floridani TaxID=2030778 RepID=A0A8H4VEM7_9HYPO|nr:hypothetical protein GQ602_003809 [Ophiocordyceps camponoti-floridani]
MAMMKDVLRKVPWEDPYNIMDCQHGYKGHELWCQNTQYGNWPWSYQVNITVEKTTNDGQGQWKFKA